MTVGSRETSGKTDRRTPVIDSDVGGGGWEGGEAAIRIRCGGEELR